MRRFEWVIAGALAAALAAGGCAKPAQPDAYGNVEATEVVVGAEGSGQLTAYTVADGATLAAGAVVGTIDPTPLTLERDQLIAQRGATASRVNEVRQQIDVIQAQRSAAVAQRDAAQAQRQALVAQHEVAQRAYERTGRLFAQQAATSQQLDQTERDYRVLTQQIKAQDDQIAAAERQIAAQAQQVEVVRAQQQSAGQQVAAADAQIARMDDRIRRTQIRNPLAGTVLTTYAKAGELVQNGQPLYKIADLTSVEVRAYVTEPQLATIVLGQAAQVSIDAGAGQRRSLPGVVSWVSAQAEFTPTPIQTRDERADLVYAVKIRTPNPDGALKIGMPVDVQFTAASASR